MITTHQQYTGGVSATSFGRNIFRPHLDKDLKPPKGHTNQYLSKWSLGTFKSS